MTLRTRTPRTPPQRALTICLFLSLAAAAPCALRDVWFKLPAKLRHRVSAVSMAGGLGTLHGRHVPRQICYCRSSFSAKEHPLKVYAFLEGQSRPADSSSCSARRDWRMDDSAGIEGIARHLRTRHCAGDLSPAADAHVWAPR